MSNQNQSHSKTFYPNQKRITTHKKFKEEKLDGAGGSMIVAYWQDVVHVAQLTQNSTAVLLWEFFFKNEDGYTIGLSPDEIKRTLWVGKTAYNNAIATLIREGFLKLREGSRVHYDFYPYPWRE